MFLFKFFFRLVFVCTLAVGLAACEKNGKPRFHNTDITGYIYAQDFSLKNPDGKLTQLADFKGKVVVVFFGYTQCPDICPTTLTDMAQAMKLLGKDADKVQVIFVTVDPERDTPELLKAYVPNFDSRFIGLYGDAAQTQKVTKEFKVVYQKSFNQDKTNYTVDHTAASYIFDANGKVRLYVPYQQKPEFIAEDIRQLLK